jgi:3-hydroxyacyl-[acyl-carrier-protein] dehydratase
VAVSDPVENAPKKGPQTPVIPPGVKTELDIAGILKCLPHRNPFVMVDRVIGIKGERLHGYKNITMNEPYFQGHFPEMPVFPGVLQIEAIGQLGGIFAAQAAGVPFGEAQIILVGVDNVRFRRMVIPGDKLDLEAYFIRRKGPFWRMGGVASVNGETACECELLAWVGTKDQKPKM